MGYDLAGRLTSITHGKIEITPGEMWYGTQTVPLSLGTSNLLAAYFLTYDQDDRVTSYSSWVDKMKTVYTYDETGAGTGTTSTVQLASAISTRISGLELPFPAPLTESYNLDVNGRTFYRLPRKPSVRFTSRFLVGRL